MSESTSPQSAEIDRFYTDLFTKNPDWSTPQPNADESARWVKIAAFLEHLHRDRLDSGMARFRILDVGCGRGWLTALASEYGEAEGVDPVEPVIAHARRLFPQLRFTVGGPESVLNRSDFAPYDVVIASEVLEHVTGDRQPEFAQTLRALLRPEGLLIVTTPRAEAQDAFRAAGACGQPVEDWLSEPRLEELFVGAGFQVQGQDRVFFEVPGLSAFPEPTPADLAALNLIPLYQVWALTAVHPESARVERMPGNPPRVSVIVSGQGNSSDFAVTLSSVLAQTLKDFEVIVASARSSGASRFNNEKQISITWLTREPFWTPGAARNAASAQARGDYIAYVQPGDRLLPNHLETLLTHLESLGAKVAYTDASLVGQASLSSTEVDREAPDRGEFDAQHLLVANSITPSQIMHARSCLDTAGQFDEALPTYEMWDFLIRLSRQYSFAHIRQPTVEVCYPSRPSDELSDPGAAIRATEQIYAKYRSGALPQRLADEQRQQLLQERVSSMERLLSTDPRGRALLQALDLVPESHERPVTPVWRLPLRAWDLFRRGGWSRLTWEIRAYVRWRLLSRAD